MYPPGPTIFGSSGIAVVVSALLGQGPAYIAFVGWALSQQFSIPRQFRKTPIFGVHNPAYPVRC